MDWILGTKEPVPAALRVQLEGGLYSSLPIFFGGVFNSVAIAAIAAWRQPSHLFLTWLGLEIAIGLFRLPVIIGGHRAIRAGRNHPAALAAFLACAWSASVGFGALISLTSGDWVLATIVCLSAAAMVCGICLRNFGTPRLAALMVVLMFAPSAIAGPMTDEPIVMVISIQLPIFILTIFAATFSLHRMLVSRMTALAALEKSERFNRTILESSPDYTLILDEAGEITFYNRPNSSPANSPTLIGAKWVSFLPPEDREAAERMLAMAAAAGERGNLVTSHTDEGGNRRWFDVIASRISDDSGRVIIVSRDITHQKNSEEQALWMARHDPLTRLPNRAVLQDALDAMLIDRARGAGGALLIVDVDNFKTINDTLGHDAGDALLCTFADRLRAALRPGDLVTRTGGDEFAFLVSAKIEEDVSEIVQEIYTALAKPFVHDGRTLGCGASIGASLIPRDGASRSEIMKAADIALYAAKAGGRGQLKIFAPAMKAQVEHREAMMASARLALQLDRIAPWYQPKVSLRGSRIVGFEALMRWTDADDAVRGPDEVMAAFNDPVLGAALSERMIERTLDQMRAWLRAGIAFGHVALNATAADFHREGFAETLIAALEQRGITPSLLQIEVTETVFLGRDSGYVGAALQMLSDRGVRIALDDFGTGYASLSHLNQFPVDLLKIDRSFIGLLGRSPDAEAISCAVINLGRSLGLEVVAEGIETEAQETHLIALGCTTGQGFLYSGAVQAAEVPRLLAGWQHTRPAGKVADAA